MSIDPGIQPSSFGRSPQTSWLTTENRTEDADVNEILFYAAPLRTVWGAMKLERTVPRLGPHPELLSFRCQQCGHVVTLVAEDER
jgi:hypothetical protein